MDRREGEGESEEAEESWLSPREKRSQSRRSGGEAEEELLPRQLSMRIRQRKEQMTRDAQMMVLHPLSRFRTNWDTLILVILVASVLELSFALGFLRDYRVDALFVLNRIVDLLLLADCGLNMFTGFVTWNGEVILERRRVMARYLRSWFLLDLVSSLPYEWFILWSHGNVRTGFQVSMLIKLLRIFRGLRQFSRWERTLPIRRATLALCKFTLSILLLAHGLACLFAYVGWQEYENGGPSWIGELQLGKSSLGDKYTAALYWSLTIVTTIGFGDVSAMSTSERIVSLFAMIIGAGVYVVMLGRIVAILSSIEPHKESFRRRMDNLQAYMSHRNLPTHLQSSIRAFVMERSGEKQWHDLLIEERRILQELSPELRTEVLLHVNEALVQRISWLRTASREFAADLLSMSQPMYFAPGEIVVHEGHVADAIFLLVRGEVQVTKRGLRLAVLKHDAEDPFLGETPLLTASDIPRRSATVRARTFCDFRALSYRDLALVIRRHGAARVAHRLKVVGERRQQATRTLLEAWRERHRAAEVSEGEGGSGGGGGDVPDAAQALPGLQRWPGGDVLPLAQHTMEWPREEEGEREDEGVPTAFSRVPAAARLGDIELCERREGRGRM